MEVSYDRDLVLSQRPVPFCADDGSRDSFYSYGIERPTDLSRYRIETISENSLLIPHFQQYFFSPPSTPWHAFKNLQDEAEPARDRRIYWVTGGIYALHQISITALLITMSLVMHGVNSSALFPSLPSSPCLGRRKTSLALCTGRQTGVSVGIQGGGICILRLFSGAGLD